MKNLKTIMVIILIFEATSILTAKANNNKEKVITIEYKIGNITELLVSSGVDIYISQGGTNTMFVEIDERIKKHFQVEKSDNLLSIALESKWFTIKDNYVCRIFLTIKDMNSIRALGGSNIYFKTPLKTSSLKLTLSGGCDLKDLEIVSNKFDVTLSGGSDLYARGEVKDMFIKASGGSDLHCKNLDVNNMIICASGGSDGYIRVKENLDLSLTGGSDLYVYGKPKVINKDISASSDIKYR